jgi:hypothetical protein
VGSIEGLEIGFVVPVAAERPCITVLLLRWVWGRRSDVQNCKPGTAAQTAIQILPQRISLTPLPHRLQQVKQIAPNFRYKKGFLGLFQEAPVKEYNDFWNSQCDVAGYPQLK